MATQSPQPDALQIQFEDSPKEIRDLLTSAEFAHIVQGISDAHELNEEQYVQLLNEVTLACLGLSDLKEFPSYIRPIVQDDAQADAIATEVYMTLLEPHQGLIPASISPRIDNVADTPEAAPAEPVAPQQNPAPKITDARPKTESVQLDTVPAQPKTSNLASSRTMHSDIETIQKVGERAPKEPANPEQEQESAVPRYARPLTDTPKYTDEQSKDS